VLTIINRTFESLTLAVVFACELGCTAMAQQPATTPSTPQVDSRELQNFSQFLLNHPNMAKQVQQNPSLLNDPNFQAQNPELQTFLKNHPGVAQQIQANPTRFGNDTQKVLATGGEVTRGQAARTDEFLNNHPDVAQELRKDPSLIDNKQYLAQHPQLQGYLNKHPEIAHQWKDHPEKFDQAQTYYDNHHPPKTQQAKAQAKSQQAKAQAKSQAKK